MKMETENGVREGVAYEIARGSGHPLDKRPGFDVMVADAPSRHMLERFIETATQAHWRLWNNGWSPDTGSASGILYKPCGQKEAWLDSFVRPHPGNQVRH